ncbi:MAG: TldD/PmbA family protein [Clostridia bacterium]|nr:TldD/PmbA family protein [Clostridia bacterium]
MDRKVFVEKLFLAAKNAGIDEFEAYFETSDDFSVDVMDGEIREYSASNTAGVCFRGLYAGRMGYASSEEMDEEAIEMLVEGVKGNALLIETDDKEIIYGGDSDYAVIERDIEKISDMHADEKIQLALDMEKAMREADERVVRSEGCGYMSGIHEKQIVNSKGLDVSFKTGTVGAVVAPIVSENGKVNFAFDMKFAFDKKDVDVKELAERAVDEAIKSMNASSIPSGSYKAIFRNDVAATMLGVFSSVFSGENAKKGLTLLKGREGEMIASECVTITDDPLLETGFASTPFDAEGVKTYTKDVVKDGKLMTLLHSLKTCPEKSTGNASKAGYSAPVQVAPTNFYLAPGDISLDEMIESVENGIMITSLMGMHSGANQISGDFSLGAKGFLIENGKIVRPVDQITVAGNFFEVLKKVTSIAADLRFARPSSVTSIGAPSFMVQEIAVAGL